MPVTTTGVAVRRISGTTVGITQIKDECIVMESELASACSSVRVHSTPPAVKERYDRWTQSLSLNELHGNLETWP